MGIQTMGSQGVNLQSHSAIATKESSSVSWYNRTLEEVDNELLKGSGNSLGLGSMNLDELLNTVWTESDSSCSVSASSSLQRQASLSLARALSGKTVDEVWRDIQHGEKKRHGDVIKSEREPTLGEMTLEDFLVKAGIFAEANFGNDVRVDNRAKNLNFMQQMSLSPCTSIETFSDTPISYLGRKRDAPDALEKMDRRQRRMMKNRESAARSRARKQAYHNELVNKVAQLEELNTMLKKEKEMDSKLPFESPSEPKYQLRRTSSSSF